MFFKRKRIARHFEEIPLEELGNENGKRRTVSHIIWAKILGQNPLLIWSGLFSSNFLNSKFLPQQASHELHFKPKKRFWQVAAIVIFSKNYFTSKKFVFRHCYPYIWPIWYYAAVCSLYRWSIEHVISQLTLCTYRVLIVRALTFGLSFIL